MRYSLIDREIERNGVLDAARELGISIIAYSPLAQGLLTGKFHGADPIRPAAPRKWMKRFKPEGRSATEALVQELHTIAAAHDATPAQIALAWVTQRHGELIVAIPGASSVSQAHSNAAALEVTLTPEELDLLADAGTEAEQRLKSKG